MEALFEAALRLAAPLLLAAIGELLVQRSGVVNIGIEGTMLCGAFVGFAVAVSTGSALAGVTAAATFGALVGALFAYFAVVRTADQIVAGMAINLLALGATGLASRALYAGAPPAAPTLSPLDPSSFGALPGVVAALLHQTPFAHAALLLTVGIGFALARTRLGLRLRAVGESARAADAEGVSVARLRFGAVLVGSALAGVAGAALTLDQSGTFTEGMTAGRGFIALSLVIFGRWQAGGVALAALFFGAATALQFRLQARGGGVPYPLFLMLPYALTLVVLAVATVRTRAPADLGRAYRRGAAP